MSEIVNTYKNPRIEFAAQSGNPEVGEVVIDPAKTTWVMVMLAFGTVGSALTISVSAVLLFLVFTAVTLCLGHSLGMHRKFIHQSYDCPKWLEYLFVHLGVLVGLAGPIGMLTTHDTRDWAQRQPSCHDYFAHRRTWYQDLWWQIFCAIKLTHAPEFKIEKEVMENRVYQLMEKYWMWHQLPWAILFYSIGGWSWVFWGICTRVSVSVLGHWYIGYIAHNDGQRDWHVADAAVQGYNVRWAALITMGESWHNNHHAFPSSAKLGVESGQWDPGWWVLEALRKLGMVSNVNITDVTDTRKDLLRLTR